MGRIKVLACALLLASCNSPTRPDGNDEIVVTRLREQPFSYSYNSGLRESQRLVIRDQTAWLQTWAAIYNAGPTSVPPPLPSVDFTREMIIVAALGERPTGGYGIFVDGATESATGVTVDVRSVSPGNGCAVTLALTQPVDIARVTRRDGAVAFVETAVVQNCN